MRNILFQQFKKKRGNVIVPPTIPSINNQLEEIAYFSAYLLPIGEKENLQTALDTYGSVRLEKGDYSGTSITMTTNQKLYGHPSLSRVSNITIASGSSNVVIKDLFLNENAITFGAGSVISNCTVKNIVKGNLQANNSMLVNNSFINIWGTINFNCSVSGYFRNNRIIKHMVSSSNINILMKGNSTTPSYGNTHLFSNFLMPGGDATDIDGLESTTFVGVDAEAWNHSGTGTNALLKLTNIGSLKITDISGSNVTVPYKVPFYDIDATDSFILNKLASTDMDVISPRTNVMLMAGKDGYSRSGGTVTGFDLQSIYNSSFYAGLLKLDGVEQTSTITEPTTINKITNSLLGTQYTPWIRTIWETLPDPTGANWKADRIGKTDQTAYIQNLINTNGIADLPEGIFYIGSTLNIPLDSSHGIVGKGTGKTAIIGLTDDFPLITIGGGETQNFTLSNLTLQGGSVGVFSSVSNTQIAFENLKYIVFRDQMYGIHLRHIMGIDNNFFEHLGFVNCSKAFFQDPLATPPDNGFTTMTYVDKTVFYECQFINCATGVSMLATRADNLNLWYNCKFDGGTKAIELINNNSPIIANCDFTNITGNYVVTANSLSIYSSVFQNNTSSVSTISSPYLCIEGCDFLDNTKLISEAGYNSLYNYVFNSTITGNAFPTLTTGDLSAVFSNSILLSNPSLSKLLVNINHGTPTVILNATPNPYPQLLVTQ